MIRQKFFIRVTALVLLLSFSARSQEPLRGLDDSAATAVRKKAIDLLESVAGQVDSLRSAENRARIRSNVAELLWNHDEKRSRSLFAAVEEDIKAGFNETDTDDATRNHTLMVFGQLRRDTLVRIAKHDPELASNFLQATRLPPEMHLPDAMANSEKSMELRLATQIAARNPQLALKLGRQSLAKGVSPDLLTVFSQLQRKDKDAALSFFKEIVDKLKSVNLADDSMATELAINLARSFQPAPTDDSAHRDLIGVLLTSALANGCAEESNNTPYMCFQIGSIFSMMEGYYGQRAAPLRRWARNAPGYSFPQMPAEVNEAIENGTVDELLALAAEHPELQQQISWKAMMKAQVSGDFVTARRIASNISDEDQRRYMLGQIDRTEKSQSVDAEKLAAIQQELRGLSNNEERIGFLLSAAIQVGGTDRKAALGLLSQAGQIIDSLKPGRIQIEGKIGLAMMYCSLKSDRGFTIIESLIPRFNELVAASATLDGFNHNYLRDGEWNMSGEGEVGRLLNAVAQNAGFFAALDFDRSVNLAGQMERPELRLMAKLKIAQGVLASPPNPARMFQAPGFIR
ncbi:MAG: hypothetical protein H7Z16_18960 [Pyrinomonadaceae bacterium]|nr:hypothetical protein [Pyrinomonadaceae bacterium]